MPRLKWTPAALSDLARLHAFLAEKNPDAAKRAIRAIRHGVKILGKHPEIGRPVEGMLPGFRERVIPFGQRGYVSIYFADEREVLILAVRHGREDGY